jgi:hypothetical protein
VIGIGDGLAMRRYAAMAKVMALREANEKTGLDHSDALSELVLLESECNFSCVKWDVILLINRSACNASIRTKKQLSREFSLYDARQQLCRDLVRLAVLALGDKDHG